MQITKADMAKIQALLPHGLTFFWDEGAIWGLFVVSSSSRKVTLAADDWQRAVCPGDYLSVHGMPRSPRVILPSGRGWHGVAASTLRGMLSLETVT